MNFYSPTLSLILLVFVSCKNLNGQSNDRCTSTYDSTLERHVYTFVEEMPQYPGGEEKLLNFFRKNFKYPTCIPSDFRSRVYVTFIIEPDGTMSNLDIFRKTDNLSSVAEETLRVFRLMPSWVAGECNGKAVPVRLTFPIQICLR